jgi:hypothetical protein
MIRGQKVMLDRDLAELYGVQVKRLKQAVRRNMERFPEDFMFELTKVGVGLLRSQFATLKQGSTYQVPPLRLHRARHPYARQRAPQRAGHCGQHPDHPRLQPHA